MLRSGSEGSVYRPGAYLPVSALNAECQTYVVNRNTSTDTGWETPE